MSDDTSFEQLVLTVRSLGHDDVAVVGKLPPAVITYWSEIVSTVMIITGERLGHLYRNHPETDMLLVVVLQTMLDPDEIHRNKDDPDMAIFWKSLDLEGRYWMRAALLVRPSSPGDASILSARRTRKKDYEREKRQGRTVWERGA